MTPMITHIQTPDQGRRPLVVFALKDLNGGGAERAVLNVIRNWSSTTSSPALLLCRYEGPYLDEVPENVRLTVLNASTGVRNTVLFGRRLRSALEDLEVQMVVSTLTAMNKGILRARKLGYLSAPVAAVEQTNLSVRLQGKRFSRVRKREMKTLYNSAERIITCSQGLADDLADALSLASDRIECIHNPIDVEQVRKKAWQNNTEPLARHFDSIRRPIICAAGRLSPQKAFDDLIVSFSRLEEDLKGSLVILGEGEEEERLKDLASSLGVCSDVYFPGFSNNPWWYVARSQVFALSSHWEGFGNVLVEAMACATPVVSTDCPYGPGEIVKHGVDGLLVEPGDLDGLSEALSAVLKNPMFAKRLAEAGQVRSNDFDARTVSLRYSAL